MRMTPMRILVVDDSQDTARMMKVLLKADGHEAKVAFAGREAIEVARTFLPDVVLLDLKLPDMGGLEVAGEIRKVEACQKAAIIAISGYDADRTSSDFDGHFVKPVDHGALSEFLSRMKDRAQKAGGRLPPVTAGT